MGERRSNFAIFVVWISSYVSAESLEPEGSISSCRFYGRLTDCYSYIFSVIHPVDELSFTEMKT